MNREPSSTESLSGIVYSRYESHWIASEQCVPEHGISYVLAGSLRVIEGGQTRVFGTGSVLFYRKNFLAKFIKQPAENGPFLSITVVFDRATLVDFSQQQHMDTDLPGGVDSAVKSLTNSPDLHRFFDSLLPYFGETMPASLATLRQREALTLLLRMYPDLQPVVFDFGQPGKIDLEVFMRQNFRFNVGLKQLAYLTGRSLATFKRDFDHVFHTSPNRWLYQKRLEEAHYLLREERMRPSDVYHEVGFESLAHFSNAFKHFFGHNPSSVSANISF